MLVGLFCCGQLSAQIADGSHAPNFTLIDINGVEHTLYDYLDDGKTVVIDFFATWCGPCWSYHQTHALEDLYTQYGDDFMVLGIEVDLGTNDDCMYGLSTCSGTTQGDWTNGISYPQFNVTSGQVADDYEVSYYPTIYTICPNRTVYESGQQATGGHATWANSCSLAASVASTTTVNCFEDMNGAIDIDVSGGHNTIYFNWSNGESTEDISGVNAGMYSCIVTESNGVKVELTDILIEGPTQPLEATTLAMENVGCNGENTGIIEVEGTGGVGGYQYSWSNGATSTTISDLAAGTYVLTITDNNSCVQEFTYDITEPDVLEVSFTSENENCESTNGSVTATANGGTSNYTYELGGVSNGTGKFNNLVADTYELLVSDANGCTWTQEITIENIPGPTVDVGADLEFDCVGAIQLTAVIEGSDDYYVNWMTSDGEIVEGADTETPTVFGSGTYTIEVVDFATGCRSNDQVVVTSTGEAPEAMISNADPVLTCATSSLTLDGSNSSSGSDITYTWTTTDGNIVSGQNTNSIAVDAPGTYTLTVTNTVSNCSDIQTIEVSGNNVPPEVDILGEYELNCDQTSTTLALDFMDNLDLEVVWTFPNGTEESATSIETSMAGHYTVTATDAMTNCVKTIEFDVIDNSENPDVSFTAPAIFPCGTDGVDIIAEVAGTGEYNYAWSTNDGYILDGEDQGLCHVGMPGNYSLVVQNVETNCFSTIEVMIGTDGDLPEIEYAEPTTLDCDNQISTIDASASGSMNDFAFTWTTDDGSIVSGANTPILNVEVGGTYVLQLTNINTGCTSYSLVEVEDSRVLPIADFTSDVNNRTVELTNTTSGDYDQIYWSFGDGAVYEGEQERYTYNYDGTYQLCVTVVVDCGSTTSCQEIVIQTESEEVDINTIRDILPSSVGSGDPEEFVAKPIEIQVIKDQATHFIAVKHNAEGTSNVQLYSLQGKLLYHAPNYKGQVINLNDMLAGVYVLNVEINGEINSRKLYITR